MWGALAGEEVEAASQQAVRSSATRRLAATALQRASRRRAAVCLLARARRAAVDVQRRLLRGPRGRRRHAVLAAVAAEVAAEVARRAAARRELEQRVDAEEARTAAEGRAAAAAAAAAVEAAEQQLAAGCFSDNEAKQRLKVARRELKEEEQQQQQQQQPSSSVRPAQRARQRVLDGYAGDAGAAARVGFRAARPENAPWAGRGAPPTDDAEEEPLRRWARLRAEACAITESLDAVGLRAAALARLGPVPPACSPGYV